MVRRYGALWDKPAPQMKDYVQAFQACIRAFRREERLSYEGRYYSLSLLPEQWTPVRHEFGNIKIDISAVGPLMCRVAGELCDGLHVHPMHSMPYIQKPTPTGGSERRRTCGARCLRCGTDDSGVHHCRRYARGASASQEPSRGRRLPFTDQRPTTLFNLKILDSPVWPSV